MSVSGYPNSPLGKEPPRFYEGDPYRARSEAGATPARGILGPPAERRFQINGNMAPQMTYGNREDRDWIPSGQYPYQSNTGYHSECHSSGYQSSGPPINNLGRPNNHVNNNICLPFGHPENSYPSDGYPIKTFVHHNSYTPPRHPEFNYPSSGHPINQHLPAGHPSNGPPISRPHENGFIDDPSHHHPPAMYHSSANGPAHPPSREFWRHAKPHPHHDHTKGPPPPMHDGGGGGGCREKSTYRPVHPDTNYRPPGTGYIPGPDGSNFRAEDGCHGHWRNSGPPRDKMVASPASRPLGGWESSDPRYHTQRKLSESNLRKNFIMTSEERRHSYMPLDRNSGPYSPSLSSQSSWSPGVDETGSPRLRMPLPSPSTPEDWHAMPDLHTPDHHHHQHSTAESHSGHHVFSSAVHSPKEKERSRDFGLLRVPDSGRTLSPGGRGSRDERRTHYSRYERRAPAIINGLEPGGDGCHSVRDPRQANYGRKKLGHRRVLLEHSYSKKYRENSDKHPRFHRIDPCSNINPELLTPLRSSSTATREKSLGQATTQNVSPLSERDSTSSTFSVVSTHSEKSPPSPVVPSIRPKFTGSSTDTASLDHSAAITSRDRSLSISDAKGVESKRGSAATSLGGEMLKWSDEKSDTIQAKQRISAGEENAPHTKPKSRKTLSNEKKASSSPLRVEALGSLEGFHLDLDPEGTTSGSNSTCCSESEEMAEERGGDDSDTEDKEEEEEEEEGMAVDGTESSSDESLSLTLCEGSNHSLEKKSPEKWSVCLPEPGKIRFSRLDNMEDSTDSERLSVKQMTSNRIQLRNGRVLPSSSLAFFTTSQKVLSPPQQPSTFAETTRSPPVSSPSPLRRSKRLAVAGEESTPQLKEMGSSTTGSDVAADQSFEMQLSEEHTESSDESEFDLPAFDPAPLKSGLPESALHKTSPVRGKRGRGRGRRGRRWTKKGGSQNSEKNDSHSGVQFYVHEPRTREEDGILQRRLALELEVKRNEKMQSEQLIPSATRHIDNTRDDDRQSMVSLPASSSSLDSHLQTSSKASTNSNSTDFSAELIARVKKISTARSSGDTPLHKCCRTGKFDMVRYLLLVENCPVNVQDNAGWTPLHEATSNGHTDVAELLLQHGADSNASARDGTRPIHDAIEIGCLELVKLLIDYKSDVMMEYGERTAVEFAMDHNQLEIAEYIKDVIQMRQESRKASLAATTRGRHSTHQKTTATRMSKKDKLLKQAEDNLPRIPVNGYGPANFHHTGSVSFGEELDFPLFYVSPIVELSSKPYLPVYNFQISPLGTRNPRRHNFYLLEDILEALDVDEDELVERCGVNILELSVAEFVHRIKDVQHNLQVSVPDKIRSLPHKQPIKFFPLCHTLSQMLDIVTENLDN